MAAVVYGAGDSIPFGWRTFEADGSIRDTGPEVGQAGRDMADKSLKSASPEVRVSSFDRYYEQFLRSRSPSDMKLWRIILTDGREMTGHPYASSQINVFDPVFSFVSDRAGSLLIPFRLLAGARLADDTESEEQHSLPSGSTVVAQAVRKVIPNADVAADLDLLRAALLKLRPPLYERPVPRWVLVRSALGHGSAVGAAICDALGLDPDELVPPEDPPEWMEDLLGPPEGEKGGDDDGTETAGVGSDPTVAHTEMRSETEAADVPPGDVRLRDLGGSRPISEWCALTWAQACDVCDADHPYAPADEREWVYDGEPVVCANCGQTGSTSVDEVGAHIVWRDAFLRDSALAGFRRLLKILTPEGEKRDAK